MKEAELSFSDRAAWFSPPWKGAARLISLWDMNEYLVPRLVVASYHLTIALMAIREGVKEPESLERRRATIAEFISKFKAELEFLGLPVTVKAAERCAAAANTKGVEASKLDSLLQEIDSRFQDEAASLPLFYVHPERLRYYNQTALFGEQFKSSFPKANTEIIEAGNCFAFDRYSACVFHLMRAMEIVLRALFVALGMPPRVWSSTKWSSLLDRIDRKIRRNNEILGNDPSWQQDRSFFEGAHGFIAAVRGPIRNKTMHVETVYDEPGAENVFDAVKSFMRHVATRLKEP